MGALSPPRFGFTTFVVTALVGATCLLVAQGQPRLPYESWGACPFECCTYRTWTVKADTGILTKRRDGAPTGFTVRKGARVSALTGVVVTTKFGRAVVGRKTTVGQRRVDVEPGDELLLITYEGEGVWKYSLRGAIDEAFVPDEENCRLSAARSATMFAQCAVQVKEPPRTTWWVRIRNGDGREGWTRQVDHFGNIDACGG